MLVCYGLFPEGAQLARVVDFEQEVVCLFEFGESVPQVAIEHLLYWLIVIDRLDLLMQQDPLQPHHQSSDDLLIGLEILLILHPSPHMFCTMQGELCNRRHCRFGRGKQRRELLRRGNDGSPARASRSASV